jgi:hypothetical protein
MLPARVREPRSLFFRNIRLTRVPIRREKRKGVIAYVKTSILDAAFAHEHALRAGSNRGNHGGPLFERNFDCSRIVPTEAKATTDASHDGGPASRKSRF